MNEENLPNTLDHQFVHRFLLDFTDVIVRERDELSRMDAECGDGDFGATMYVAFSNIRKSLENNRGGNIGAMLNSTGHEILSSAGGASGPLFGTFFMEAGKSAIGKKEIGVVQLAEMIELATQEIKARGGAKLGDKTLVDALEPAVNSLRESARDNSPMLETIQAATRAAEMGYESTRNMIAKHGKARYLGDQTIGHTDPGAHVIALLFETLLRSYKSKVE